MATSSAGPTGISLSKELVGDLREAAVLEDDAGIELREEFGCRPARAAGVPDVDHVAARDAVLFVGLADRALRELLDDLHRDQPSFSAETSLKFE